MVSVPVVVVIDKPVIVLLVKASAPAKVAKVPEVGRVTLVPAVVVSCKAWLEVPKVIVPVVPAPKTIALPIEIEVPDPVMVFDAVETAKVNPAAMLRVLVPLA